MCNNNNAHTPQQLEYDHVVLTETFIRLASTDDVSNETWPVARPLVLENLPQSHNILSPSALIYMSHKIKF